MRAGTSDKLVTRTGVIFVMATCPTGYNGRKAVEEEVHVNKNRHTKHSPMLMADG